MILAEIGADPSRFATAADLASWAGMCPGNNQSGLKTKAAPTRPGDPWLKGVLGQVAVSASRTKGTHLAARYRRIASRRGKKRALVAVGHSVLIAVWTMLTRDVTYQDLGGNYFIEHLNRVDDLKATADTQTASGLATFGAAPVRPSGTPDERPVSTIVIGPEAKPGYYNLVTSVIGDDGTVSGASVVRVVPPRPEPGRVNWSPHWA